MEVDPARAWFLLGIFFNATCIGSEYIQSIGSWNELAFDRVYVTGLVYIYIYSFDRHFHAKWLTIDLSRWRLRALLKRPTMVDWSGRNLNSQPSACQNLINKPLQPFEKKTQWFFFFILNSDGALAAYRHKVVWYCRPLQRPLQTTLEKHNLNQIDFEFCPLCLAYILFQACLQTA